jgi:hypothetical protein
MNDDELVPLLKEEVDYRGMSQTCNVITMISGLILIFTFLLLLKVEDVIQVPYLIVFLPVNVRIFYYLNN